MNLKLLLPVVRYWSAMNDQTLTAEVKKLNARVAALEKLLERIIRQRPVSEKQLERELKNRGLIAQRESLRH
jgi:hypothetical protein